MTSAMNIEEAQARIAQLEAELQQSKTKQIQLKVSGKGCVQINGIRKFPFTFYQDEIKIILNMSDEIENFINLNQNKLSKKKR